MRKEFERIEFACGDAAVLEGLEKLAAKRPFSNDVTAFLDALSARLRRLPDIRSMPDVAAFAFWCRRANITQLERGYGGERRLGRGVILHFAPSNIPTLFAYSIAAGLLAGNSCAVRLPSVKTKQAEAICGAINGTAKGTGLERRIAVFRCGHDRDIIDGLSALCDVRVIWGGDASVAEIRRSPLKPLATELPFADRKSAAVFDAQAVLDVDDLEDTYRRFFNDTYLNDQNACSSPRMIYWLGNAEKAEKAQKRFWDGLECFLRGRYEPQAATSTEKATAAAVLASMTDGAKIKSNDNLIVRVSVPELKPEMWNMTAPGGFFIEAVGGDIDGVLPIFTEVCQTVCCLGDIKNTLKDAIVRAGVKGGDRVVGVGESLDFGLIWDGRDLIRAMSREIV